MTHFVQHHYPTWEFIRRETNNHKQRRLIVEKMIAEAELARGSGSEMWWADQRLVDQVAPSNEVNPRQLDTFNYRYQVYASPMRAPQSLAAIVHNKCPVAYNVKRMAIDKMWNPDGQVCTAHRPTNPQKIHYCPIVKQGDTKNECCNTNNNLTLQQKLSTDHCDGSHGLQPLSRISGYKKIALEQGKAGLEDSQNSNHYQRHCPSERGSESPSESESLLSDCNENVGQRDTFNLHHSGGVVQNYNCNRTMGASKHFLHDRPRVSAMTNRHLKSSNDLLHFDGINRIKNVSKCPVEIGLARVMAKNTANHNKAKINKDNVADLLGNQNNNTSAELGEGGEILVDNLIGLEVGIPGADLKHVEYKDESRRVIFLKPRTFQLVNDCWNNNASEWEYDRPKCIPGQYQDSVLFSTTPHPPERQCRRGKCENRSTPCMEMLGHIESHGRPRCTSPRSHSVQPDYGRASETREKGPAELDAPEISYKSYKIVGSRQYAEPPARDYLSKVKFPPHLEEYREFTRRSPYPTFGRFDRSDPAYEMLAPSQKASNTMSVSRSPFIYTRNPKRFTARPLFYEPVETDNLNWCLPSAIVDSKK